MWECKCGETNPDSSFYCQSCGNNKSTSKYDERSERKQQELREKEYIQKMNYNVSTQSENMQSIPQYVVLQVTLKERFFGTGSGNLSELESVINRQAAKGYRLHTISTASAHSTGLAGGDRIQATMVFERI